MHVSINPSVGIEDGIDDGDDALQTVVMMHFLYKTVVSSTVVVVNHDYDDDPPSSSFSSFFILLASHAFHEMTSRVSFSTKMQSSRLFSHDSFLSSLRNSSGSLRDAFSSSQ